VSVALAPWPGSSPKTSSRRVSAASCAGRGIATTSANVVRNPSASVSGNFTRSSGTEVGRRIAPSSPQRNLPSAVTSLCRQSDKAGFVQPAPNFFPSRSERVCEPHRLPPGCRGAVGMLASACRERGVVRAGRVSSGLREEAPSGSVLLCCPVFPDAGRRPTAASSSTPRIPGRGAVGLSRT